MLKCLHDQMILRRTIHEACWCMRTTYTLHGCSSCVAAGNYSAWRTSQMNWDWWWTKATVDRVVILVMQVQPAIIEGKTALMKRGTAATWPCKHNCREPDVTYDFIMKMTASLRLYTWYSFRAAARACMQFHAYWTHPTQHAHEHD